MKESEETLNMSNVEMIFQINGETIANEEVKKWEYKRLIVTYNKMKKIKNVHIYSDFQKWIQQKDVEKMRMAILESKLQLGIDKLRLHFKTQYTIGNTISKLGVILSKKCKCSITEIYIPQCEASAQEICDRITAVMLQNNKEHLKVNLMSNPDHYVLQSVGDNIQEVVEFTGGSPFPTRFFAHYGDEQGVKTPQDREYECQLVGSARLEDGFLLGGIRHQIRNEGKGIRFKALVEFPSILPQYMIDAHCLHLACEFGVWLSYAVTNAKSDDNMIN